MKSTRAYLICLLFITVSICYADDDETARLGLEYLQQGMINSDIVVNQFMDVSDALLLAKAESMFATDPVEIASASSIWAATHGDLFIIPTDAVGAWSTHTKDLAIRLNGAWKYYTRYSGMRLSVDCDLVPNQAAVRATFPAVVQYDSASQTWDMVTYSRVKTQVSVGYDKIVDDLYGINYFSATGGTPWTDAKFKGFTYDKNETAIAILQAVSPAIGPYYSPQFIVANTGTPPGATALLNYTELGSVNNFALKWGRLHLGENNSTSAPLISDASVYVGSVNNGIIWISNGSDGGVDNQLYFTNESGTVSVETSGSIDPLTVSKAHITDASFGAVTARIITVTGTINAVDLKVTGVVKLPYASDAPDVPENGMIWMESDGLHLYYADAEKTVAGS